jgi:hypothetical protein
MAADSADLFDSAETSFVDDLERGPPPQQPAPAEARHSAGEGLGAHAEHGRDHMTRNTDRRSALNVVSPKKEARDSTKGRPEEGRALLGTNVNGTPQGAS